VFEVGGVIPYVAVDDVTDDHWALVVPEG
jgi:hypothetical protein